MSTPPVGDVRGFTDLDSTRDNCGSLLSDFHALSDKSPADVAKQIKEFQAGDKNDVPDGFPDANLCCQGYPVCPTQVTCYRVFRFLGIRWNFCLDFKALVSICRGFQGSLRCLTQAT